MHPLVGCGNVRETKTETGSISSPVECAAKREFIFILTQLFGRKPLAGPLPQPLPPSSSTHHHLLKCRADYSRACWEFHAADCQAKSRSPCAFYAFELPIVHFSNSIWDQPACRRLSPELFCLFLFCQRWKSNNSLMKRIIATLAR